MVLVSGLREEPLEAALALVGGAEVVAGLFARLHLAQLLLFR